MTVQAPARLALVASMLALACGCGAGVASTAPPPSAPPKPGPVITTTPTVITPHGDTNVAEMFERARKLLLDAKPLEAAKLFDEILAADPSGAYAAASDFNAGLAWESAGDRTTALDRYRDTLRRFPDGDTGKAATIRASRLLAYLEQWSELSGVADVLLARADLGDVERIEAYGAKALSLVEIGDADAADRLVQKGLDLVEAHRLGEGGRLPVEVAQLKFALGEIRKVRSEKITFVPFPPNFAAVLEQRCQGLLDAQSAYTDAMRSFDPHWAAMSGYRVGQLYQRLHADVLAIPPPKQADTEAKKLLFEGTMRLRFRVLLEKGLKMMDHTVSLGDRTGEQSAWIGRARDAKADLERALEEEKTIIARLPYSEAQLQKALDDLEKKHASDAAPPKPGANASTQTRHPARREGKN
jgi:tetratricopeptide (TPR) repeat protein